MRIPFLASALCLAGTVYGTAHLVIPTRTGLTLAAPLELIDSITVQGDSMLVHSAYGVKAVAKAIVADMNVASVSEEVAVHYDGTMATVLNPFFLQGVTATINGAHVVVESSVADTEVPYRLTGTSADGSFTMDGSYKLTLTLDNLDLASQQGAPIHIKCGKRVAVLLPEGTESRLADRADGEQKACMVFKGHPEWNGTGTLTVTARTGHAIKTGEYMQLKKGFGTLNIVAAKGDGIHAGQYFQMNGGTVNISGVEGDGIQAEVTDDPDDELNGQMIIKGGTIDIRLAGEDVAGLKSDSPMTLSGGDITINTTGAAGKGIKAKDTFVMGNKDTGEGPRLTVSTSGARLNNGTNPGDTPGGWWPGGWRPGGHGGESSSGSSSKAIKATNIAYIYGGETNISTAASGAEGLESKKTIYIEGGRHYFKCYDDCINCSGNIYFNGGVTVCHSNGNDAIDSNAGKKGAITIGDGTVFAYTTKGSPEEGFDCDNNSYIQITGHGIGISAGGAQGGGGSSSTISGAAQGYGFVTSSISYTTGRYYTLADAAGNNLVTYCFEASVRSTLALFTATGMTKGSTYTVKYSTQAPTDAATEWHGLYLGSSAQGTTNVTSFTAK